MEPDHSPCAENCTSGACRTRLMSTASSFRTRDAAGTRDGVESSIEAGGAAGKYELSVVLRLYESDGLGRPLGRLGQAIDGGSKDWSGVSR
jgi:hypothetical protein